MNSLGTSTGSFGCWRGRVVKKRTAPPPCHAQQPLWRSSPRPLASLPPPLQLPPGSPAASPPLALVTEPPHEQAPDSKADVPDEQTEFIKQCKNGLSFTYELDSHLLIEENREAAAGIFVRMTSFDLFDLTIGMERANRGDLFSVLQTNGYATCPRAMRTLYC